MVVFDLDFTLWDCGGTWCDCLSPPFCRREGRVMDRTRRLINLYPDVPRILDYCQQHNLVMALASRTEQPQWARQLIELLELSQRFAFQEIYPSSKLRHFAALQAVSEVNYRNMIFFDDEPRNTREVSTLGVSCIDVPDGLTWELFLQSLHSWESG